jgi:hypothetical protein
MKRTESAKKKLRSNGSLTKKRPHSASRYVVCVKNDDYPASLELRKLYPAVPDKTADKAGLIRVVDESGEDYLYPSDYFLPVRLPQAIEKAVRLAS